MGCPITLLLWGRGSVAPANTRSHASLHQASATERGCRSIFESRASASCCACSSRSSFLCSAVPWQWCSYTRERHSCPGSLSVGPELFRDWFPLCIFTDEMTQASSPSPLPSQLCALLCVCVGIQTSSIAWKLGKETPDAVLTLKGCICGFCGWRWFVLFSQAFDPPCLDLWQFLPSLPWCNAWGRAVSKSIAAACSQAGWVQSIECSPSGRVPCCFSPAAQRNAYPRKPFVPKGQEGTSTSSRCSPPQQEPCLGLLLLSVVPLSISLHGMWGTCWCWVRAPFLPLLPVRDVFLIQRWKGKHEFGNNALEFANKFAMQTHCLREWGNV